MPAVLVTRPKAQAESTAAWLRRDGLEPLFAPVSAVERVPATIDWHAVTGIAVTSVHAVASVVGGPPNVPIFAVGQATAAALQRASRPADAVGTGDGAALAQTIEDFFDERGQALAGALILHPTGSDRAPALADGLAARAANCRTVAVYRAVAIPALTGAVRRAIENRRIAAVLSYSTRSLRLLEARLREARLADFAGNLRLICLSPAIADAAGLTWFSRESAALPNETALRVLLEDLRC